MKSYMGIEVFYNKQWMLLSVADASYALALQEAKKIAGRQGIRQYRVRRIQEEKALTFIEKARKKPAYKCKKCGGILLEEENGVWRCEQCYLYWNIDFEKGI